MVRDVRNCLTLVHLLLLIERLKTCPCGIFSRKFVRRPTAILISTLLPQSILEIHPLTVHRILRLGDKALQGQVRVLTRMVALDVVRAVVLLRVVDVVRVVVLHLVVDVAALRRSVPLPDQQRMHPMQELYVSCDVSHLTRRGSLRTSPTRTIATRSHSWNMHTP